MSEAIVKFSGDIITAAETAGASAEIIDCGYAVIDIPEDRLGELYSIGEVEYFEPAKTIMAVSAMRNELGNTGIAPVKESVYRLNGEGVAVGIIDSGIDYLHEDFRTSDGRTRILSIWDQTSRGGEPPEGFRSGSEYSREEIDRAIFSDDPYSIADSRDTVGHGTAVAGIAAGNSGVASKSDIIAVKLGEGTETRTTDILRAVKYVTEKARAAGKPLSVNLSYGMNLGSHSGDSLFERCLDSMCGRWKISFSAAAGNEGGAGHHFSAVMESGKTVTAEFVSLVHTGILFLDIWKSFSSDLEFELIAPNGVSSGILYPADSQRTIRYGNMRVVMNYRSITHYSRKQEILFDLGRQQGFIPGIWKLNIRCLNAVDGRVDIWLPTTEEAGTNTAFLYPDEYLTLTIPSTVQGMISVGGYDSLRGNPAYFTGRGINALSKPDIAAPAVDIFTARAGGGYDSYTGTSMAAPFVCGAAAIMMEWGIVKGFRPFLYGEAVKAYLQKGARRNTNIKYPDDISGYGLLDLRRTMELLEYSL